MMEELKWNILKEFVKSKINSDKVTLKDSYHYQVILNKMYELDENNTSIKNNKTFKFQSNNIISTTRQVDTKQKYKCLD